MGRSTKAYAARPREGRRNAVSKFRRAVSMNIPVEDRLRSKLRRGFKESRQSIRGGNFIRRKALESTLFKRAV